MRSYRDRSITTKLSLLVLLAGGVAVCLSAICFVLNDLRMMRSSMEKQLTIVADVLGSNATAALSFQDSDTATQLLASLQKQPAVEYGCIYNASGQPFATYRQDPKAAQPPLPTTLGYDGNHLNVLQPITHNGQTIGKIFLRANANELRNQIMIYAVIVMALIVVSLGSSLVLSLRFQRVISRPILRLVDAAREISAQRNYGIRVEKVANDELGTLYDQFNTMLEQIQQGEAAIQRAHDELELKVERRTAELSRSNEELSHEISIRMQAEHELEETHQKLMDTARRAGMAEIATGVLHNVGNVLNSINVSFTLIYDRMRKSRVTDFMRATNLIEQHTKDLGAFITSDPKGQQLPGYLSLLAVHLSNECSEIVTELGQLSMKIDHVKAIVATQQSYAGVSGVIEATDLSTTLDDALKLNAASFERHKIKIVKEYQDLPLVQIDKQKVLQILINLIKNAREVFDGLPPEYERKVTVRTVLSEGRLQIQVVDSGKGIRTEDQTRIFSHGFTTKKTGHGFGLHSCANAAVEMGGSMSVYSDGPGTGATFILEIPYRPIKQASEASVLVSDVENDGLES